MGVDMFPSLASNVERLQRPPLLPDERRRSLSATGRNLNLGGSSTEALREEAQRSVDALLAKRRAELRRSTAGVGAAGSGAPAGGAGASPQQPTP